MMGGHSQHVLMKDLSPDVRDKLLLMLGFKLVATKRYQFQEELLGENWKNQLLLTSIDCFLVHVRCTMMVSEKGPDVLVRDSLPTSSSKDDVLTKNTVTKVKPSYNTMPWGHRLSKKKASSSGGNDYTSRTLTKKSSYSSNSDYVLDTGSKKGLASNSDYVTPRTLSKKTSSATDYVSSRTLRYPPNVEVVDVKDKGHPPSDENRNYVKVKPISLTESNTMTNPTDYTSRKTKLLKKKNNESSSNRLEQNGEYVLLFPVSRPDKARKSHLYQEIPDDTLLQMTKSSTYRTTYHHHSGR